MSKWQSDYVVKTGDTVTYGAIGSGGGIEQITARTVDFGASDAPMTPDQLSACKGCVQIPGRSAPWSPPTTSAGLRQPEAHRPGTRGHLPRQHHDWNDPAIAKLNPGVNLPSTKITPVYRSDG